MIADVPKGSLSRLRHIVNVIRATCTLVAGCADEAQAKAISQRACAMITSAWEVQFTLIKAERSKSDLAIRNFWNHVFYEVTLTDGGPCERFDVTYGAPGEPEHNGTILIQFQPKRSVAMLAFYVVPNLRPVAAVACDTSHDPK